MNHEHHPSEEARRASDLPGEGIDASAEYENSRPGDATESQTGRLWSPEQIPQTQLPLMWLVVMIPLSQRGTIIQVMPGQVMGRKGDIRWRDPRVSRRHVFFTLGTDPERYNQPAFIIHPHQDLNGTFVNGVRLKRPRPLRENDHIQMGDTVFIVKTLD